MPWTAGSTARPEVVFLTYGGCLPVRGVNRSKPGFRCNTFTDKAWQYLQTEKIDRLVIISRWIQYFYDADGQPTPYLCFSANNSCQEFIASEAQRTRLFQQLHDDLQPLRAKGVDIRLVGPVPYSTVNYLSSKSKAIAAEHLPVMPLKVMSTAQTMNAPTACAIVKPAPPLPARPAVASTAAPGVLQAIITGLRSHSDGITEQSPMPRPSAHIQEAISAGVALNASAA